MPARKYRLNSHRFPKLDFTLLEERAVPSLFDDYQLGRHGFGCLCAGCAGKVELPPSFSVASVNDFLTGPQAGDRTAVALNNLMTFAPQAGLTVGDVQNVLVTDSYTDGGLSHVYVRQKFNGLDVLNANAGVHLTADGRLITINGQMVPGLAAQDKGPANIPAPLLSPAHAVAEAAWQSGYTLTTAPKIRATSTGPDRVSVVDEPEVSDQPIPARLVYLYDIEDGMRLAWEVVMRTPDGRNWFHSGVDALTGEVKFHANWVANHGTYKVLSYPSDSPIDPAINPGNNPLLDTRSVEVSPFDPVWSPFGWHDTNGAAGGEFTDTRGNNVFAQEDQDNNNTGGARPDGGAFYLFDYPVDFSQNPQAYIPALTTNLFYANNVLHDVTAAYGFTEAAGNFQQKNYSGKGLGNDAVQADAIDGSGTDNANFATPPDGTPGRMQMYRFTTTTPNRTSDFENGIIAHEYGHGVSNRLTGGPANSSALTALQSGGMGEGWSDWLTLMMTQRPTDTPTTSIPMGPYVLGQNPVTGTGVRDYAYNFTISNKTQQSFLAFGTGTGQSTQVHWAGTRWASALWDLNWLLIAKYGYDSDLSTGYNPAALPGTPARAGNKLTFRLVLDGMKLQPVNPSFIEARNAILQADLVLTGGANRREIWTAFARRGLGFSATTANSSSSAVTAAFDLPPTADAAPAIVAITPNGTTVGGAAPTAIVVTFSEAMNPATFSVADDITSFTGPGGVDLKSTITSAVWGNGNTTLTLTFTPPAGAAANGRYELVIAPTIAANDNGALLDQDFDGVAGEPTDDAYTHGFRFAAAAFTVASVNPPNGGVIQPSVTTIDVSYSGVLLGSSVGTDDIVLSHGTVTGASQLNATTVRYTVSWLTAETPTVYLQVRYGRVLDQFGFPVAPYTQTITLDVVSAPFPPLTVYAPRGTLSYSGSVSASIAPTTDTDEFLFTPTAGSSFSVVVDQTSTLRPTITVVDPAGNPVGTNTATAAGGVARLLNITAPTGGTYKLQVTAAGGTVGGYRTFVQLGTTPEAESNGGASNNTTGTAQSINAAFVTVAPGAAVAAVSGRSDASPDLLLTEAEPNDSTATANNASKNFVATPAGTTYHLSVTGDIGTASESDWYNIGQLVAGSKITITMTGAAQAGNGKTLGDTYLELWRTGSASAVTVDDDGGPGLDSRIYQFTIPTTDTYQIRARAFSTGTGSYRIGAVYDAVGTPPQTGGPDAVDAEPNDTQATAQNIATSWRQVGFVGTTAATLGVSGDADHYQYTFAAGDRVTIQAVGAGINPQVALLNSAGVTVALYTPDTFNPGPTEAALYGFVIPTAGTYFVRVQGNPTTVTGAYTLTVGLSTTTPPPSPTPGLDHYSLTLTAGQFVSVGLTRAGTGATTLQLLDKTGAVVATGTAGPANYTLLIPSFTPAATGTYTVRVSDLSAADYTLGISRGGVLEAEPNDSAVAAAPVSRVSTVLGGLDAGNDDWYSINLSAGSDFTADTFTPGTGPGEPNNALDPVVELYRADGTKVAFDDNSGPDGKNAAVRYTVPLDKAGTYRVRVTGAGGSVGDYALAMFANAAPAGATAGGPYTTTEGGSVTLAGAATDADGDTLTYTWDLNDDGVFGDATGATPTVTWAALQALGLGDGTVLKTVTMKVTDGFVTLSAATSLTVTNKAPTATFAVASPVPEGSPSTVTFSAVVDPAPADVAAGFRFAYDLGGDGSWEVGGDSWATSDPSGTLTITPDQLPDGPGSLVVRARVYDKDDGFTEYFGTVVVTNVNPTATFTNDGAVPEGSTGKVRFNAQSDPSAGDTAAGFRYAYDFNSDGKWDLGDPADYSTAVTDSAPVVPASFFPDGPSTTKVTARIIDRNNGFTAYSTTITVTNVAPTITVANSGPVPENTAATVTITGQFDPSAADLATLRFAYDLGDDGSWEVGTPTYATASKATSAVVPAGRLASGPASFPVRVRVLDKDGGFTDAVTVIVVEEVAPTATVGNTGPVDEGGSATVFFSNPFDPSPADQAALRFAYDFGADGVWEVGPDYATATDKLTQEVPAALLADGPSGVLVRMRVIDPKGAFTEYTTVVQVNNVAPTATVTNSGPVPEAGSATVSIGGLADPSAADLANLRYAYDFDNDGTFDLGDGTYIGSVTATSAAVPAALLANGPVVRTVRVRVLDKDGGATTYTTDVVVLNVAPTGTVSNTGPITEGSPVSVGLSNLFDPSPTDQGALRFAFDFGNDGKFDLGDGTYAGGVLKATAAVPAALVADGPRVVPVRARVIDPAGGFTDYLTEITVNNAPPTATFLSLGPVPEGGTGTVRFDGVIDPSTVDTDAGFRFAYDFDNDGVFDLGDGTYAGSKLEGTATVPASVIGDGPAVRTVRGRVIDRNGGFADFTTAIAVANVAPTGVFVVGAAVPEGTASSVSFADIVDPSAGDTAAGFRFAFDFDDDGVYDSGDGTYAGSGLSPAAVVPAQFLSNGPADVAVRGRVIDRNGGFTEYVATIRVTNISPTAKVEVTGPVNVGSLVRVRLVDPADPSPGDINAGFVYSFDFNNDGDFTGPGDVPNSKSAEAEFTYANPGKYPIRARIADRDGGFTEYTTFAVVENVRPTAAAFEPTGPVSEGGAVSVRFVSPFHPGAAAQAAGLRFSYDFDNDGTFDLGDGTYAGSVKAATVAVPAGLLADSGSRTVKARVIEVNGAFTDYTTTFTVANVPPTATVVGPAAPVVLGQPATITFTNPTDPSAGDTNAGFTYGFDFDGDGVYEVVSPLPTARYTFPSAGTFPVTVRVSDASGGASVYTVPVTVVTPPPVVVPPPPRWTAVGADAGGPPQARLIDNTGRVRFNGLAFDPAFTGGVRVAVGDVNGDGTPDLIAGTGPGAATEVRVYDGATGGLLWATQPFEASFTGGVYVAAGDIDADGFAEIAITPDQGGGPRARLFTGKGFSQVADFLAIDDTKFRGGARPALADVNGDGRSDLLVSAGFGGGPRVAGYDGARLGPAGGPKLFADFFAFESTLTNGVFIAAGDVNGDGFADPILGGGPGGGPRVLALDGRSLLDGAKKPVVDFFAGDTAQRSGVRVSVADLDGDQLADILTGDAAGNAVRVHGYRGADLPGGNPPVRYILDPFPGFVGGVFVG